MEEVRASLRDRERGVTERVAGEMHVWKNGRKEGDGDRKEERDR